MTAIPDGNLGVQLLGKTNRIVAGHLNETGDDLDGATSDVTDNAVMAVAEYVIRGYESALEVDYDDGVTYRIVVTKIGPPDPVTGMRTGLLPTGEIVGYARTPHADNEAENDDAG